MVRLKKLEKPEKVPLHMKETFQDVSCCIDVLCSEFLNDEYARLLRKLAATLCRKRPSPLINSNLKTWTAGMVHAIGMANFLFDRSQIPHMSSRQISDYFGLAQSTVGNKSKQIRDMLRINQWNPNWMLEKRVDESLVVWLVELNGLIVDARHLPREIQEDAYQRGLIPYLPDEKEFNIW